MNYKSTRGGVQGVSFTDAVMMGLATDGGLLLPETIPLVTDRLDEWSKLPYAELAYEIISLFVGNTIPRDDLRSLIDRSYVVFDDPAIAPLVQLNGIYIMELFHGPTLAFKDIALQFLGNLFEYILKREDRSLNILGATSGDTGSAAICGVRGKDNIRIFVLHPHGNVSPVQERQMTTVLDDNVFNIAIEGSFDDGQRIIKALFNDLTFKKDYHLGAVNSVNWARIAAQIVYYFFGVFRVRQQTGEDAVEICVPTGNFGNIFAGYLATRMGLPVSRLILSSNENNILSDFFRTGVYSKGKVCKTYSPSMDIQVASNFERYLYYFVKEDSRQLNRLMKEFDKTGAISVNAKEGDVVDPLFAAGSGSNIQTLDTIRRVYNDTHYILDPHTAVGVAVAEKLRSGDNPTICLATAHPAKFEDTVTSALGNADTAHPAIARLNKLPTRCVVLPADVDAVRQFMIDKVGGAELRPKISN